MPSSLDLIVDIVINQQTAAIPQPSFAVPLVVGPTGFLNSDVIRYYSSAKAMLSDGFITSSPEYIYVSEAFEQALSPTLVGVGKRTAAVKQVDTLAASTLDTSHLYSFTLNGTIISYQAVGGNTQQVILTGLLAAINTAFPTNPPVTGAVTGTGVSALLTLTGSTFGLGVTYTAIDTDLTHVNTVPVNGIANDLAAIQNALTGNNWYGLCICSNQAYDILQAAAYIEATGNKIFIGCSGDANIPTSSTGDVASLLAGLGYKRTALLYSPTSANFTGGMDAAWLGGQLPQVPGSSTWKFKQLVGISPDFFTAAAKTILVGTPGVSTGKTVNIYETVGGVNITEEGWMTGGQFIDITVGLDWLKSTMQVNIYALLVNNPKVPYTDKGVAVIENAVRQTLKQGSDDGGNGLLDSTSIVVSANSVSTVPSNTRAQRILPAGVITWSARLSGAFHFVNITGTVTV